MALKISIVDGPTKGGLLQWITNVMQGLLWGEPERVPDTCMHAIEHLSVAHVHK